MVERALNKEDIVIMATQGICEGIAMKLTVNQTLAIDLDETPTDDENETKKIHCKQE